MTAADRLPDLRGKRVVYDYDEDDIKKIASMAVVGLSNESISFVVGSDPRTFDTQIAEQKALYLAGDKSPFNLYAALEKGRAMACGEIAKTAFDVAVKERNPTMLIWLSKVRLGWREKIEVEGAIKHTFEFVTQVEGGSIKQSMRQLGPAEDDAIDADIKHLTDKQCPSKE